MKPLLIAALLVLSVPAWAGQNLMESSGEQIPIPPMAPSPGLTLWSYWVPPNRSLVLRNLTLQFWAENLGQSQGFVFHVFVVDFSAAPPKVYSWWTSAANAQTDPASTEPKQHEPNIVAYGPLYVALVVVNVTTVTRPLYWSLNATLEP